MKLFGAHTSVSSRKIGNLRNITSRIAYNPQGKTRIALIPSCSTRTLCAGAATGIGHMAAILPYCAVALRAAGGPAIAGSPPTRHARQHRHTQRIAGENHAII
jgi:hypothetical protein